MIKFVDLDRQRKKLKSDINLIIKGVIEEGQFISGKEVSNLESSLEDYISRLLSPLQTEQMLL